MRYRKPIVRECAVWVALACFTLVVIADGMIGLGLSRKWQYVYNALYFVIILPLLLGIALRDKLKS